MNFFASVFQPPFSRLRIALYLLCAACFVLMPNGALQTLRLNGPSDYMTALAAMHGADGVWGLHRLLWAAAASFLPPVESAVTISLVISLLFLACLFVLLPFLGAGIMPGRRRGLIVLFALFSPALMGFFSAGALGAGPYGLLSLAMFMACLLRPVASRRQQLLWVSGAVLFVAAFIWLEPYARAYESPVVWSRALFYHQALLPCFGTFASLCFAFAGTRDRRWRYWVLFALQLSMADQAGESLYRMALFQLAALPSLTAFFFRLWDALQNRVPAPCRYPVEAALVLALTLIPVGIVPAALAQRPLVPDALFPSLTRTLQTCSLRGAGHMLTALDQPARLLNHRDIGPELKLRLPPKIALLSDSGAKGAALVEAFFDAETDKGALDIVKRAQVDYVFVCADGLAVRDGSMLSRLMARQRPDWLEPLGVVFDEQTLLYKVKKDHP